MFVNGQEEHGMLIYGSYSFRAHENLQLSIKRSLVKEPVISAARGYSLYSVQMTRYLTASSYLQLQ